MAANYWASTQRKHWSFTKKQLEDIRRSQVEDDNENKLLISQFSLPEDRLLNIYFSQQLHKLAKRMNVRQQPLATAQVYMRRFLIKRPIRKTNPYLLLSTALYLACKMEESPQHIRVVIGEARQMWPGLISPRLPYSLTLAHYSPDAISADTSKLGECEFHLISEMNSQLIVHQPYQTLKELQTEFTLTVDEFTLASYVVNDHYLTDLPLLYPPHIIAVAACLMAVVLKPPGTGNQLHPHQAQAALQQALHAAPGAPGSSTGPQLRIQKLITWLADSTVSMEAVVDSIQEIISLYDVWEQYNDKTCKEAVTRFVKACGLDK